MIVETEVDISDFPTNEVIGELEDCIEAKAIKGYHTDKHIERMKPQIAEMKKKLEEIRIFVLGY